MKENSFKLRKSFYSVVRDLSDKQVGEFFKGLCEYAFDGKPFITKDDYLKGVFLYVKRELDVSKQNAENGKKGGLVRAEMRRKSEQRELIGKAVITGEVVARQAIKTFVNNLKNEVTKEGESVAQ